MPSMRDAMCGLALAGSFSGRFMQSPRSGAMRKAEFYAAQPPCSNAPIQKSGATD
jgi:hypothetical protein